MAWVDRHSPQYKAASYPGLMIGGTVTTLALDSGDDSYAMGFICPETGNLTDLWLNIASFTGTWGSTDGVINYDIFTGQAANSRPATPATYTGTITLAGTEAGWVRKTGLTHALTAGVYYYIAFRDADGDGSNYVTVNRSSTGGSTDYVLGAVTTDSWASGATASLPNIAAKIGGTMIGGLAFHTTATLTNNRNERGVVFTPPEDSWLAGVASITDPVTVVTDHVLKVYATGVNPGGTPLTTWTNPTISSSGSIVPFSKIFPVSTWWPLTKDTEYRFVLYPATNTTVPRSVSASPGLDADLRAAFKPFGGNWSFTIESSGAWADDADKLFNMVPILVPRTATGSGGVPTFGGRAVRRA